ncbi:mycofactocin precursor MftA [Amycolatopsis sp. NPDC051371]|uniref:mycofactocin precursor MftA n=1 Tax=Amycolatopsis sp. NPDC051371 TaxID=3155800 RepID=UPI003434BAED
MEAALAEQVESCDFQLASAGAGRPAATAAVGFGPVMPVRSPEPCFWHGVPLLSSIFDTLCRNPLRAKGVTMSEQIVELSDRTDVTAAAGEEALVAEDLLVEEVSIDGMCGVY